MYLGDDTGNWAARSLLLKVGYLVGCIELLKREASGE